jgi:hypothetical protein
LPPTRRHVPAYPARGSARFPVTHMHIPPNLLLVARRALYRPAGSVSFDDAVLLVRNAIVAALLDDAEDLLVDTTSLSDFASPTTFERFLAASDWANIADGQLHLAMVARPEMIDPRKYGVTVAAHGGLLSNIFTTESDATQWLDAQRRRRPADSAPRVYLPPDTPNGIASEPRHE